MTFFIEKPSKILQWLNAKGYSGTVEDAFITYVQSGSPLTSGTMEDHLRARLNVAGYSGTMDDMLTTMFQSKTGISNRHDAERNFFSNNTLNIFSSPPSYSNQGGTGDRTSIITTTTNVGLGAGAITQLVDGVTNSGTLFFTVGQSTVGLYIKFQFNSLKLITEAKWYTSSIADNGVWKWQGSNNDTDWTDIGSSFTLGGVGTPFIQTITTLSGNTTEYLYYRITGVSGTTSDNPNEWEMEFKIS